MSACKCRVVYHVDFFQVYIDFKYEKSSLTKGAHGDVSAGFPRILSLSQKSSLTKGAHGDVSAGFPRILSLSRRILSLTSDCCYAQDFRNQRLPAPALSLLVHCLPALCFTAFMCVHATLSVSLSEPAS